MTRDASAAMQKVARCANAEPSKGGVGPGSTKERAAGTHRCLGRLGAAACAKTFDRASLPWFFVVKTFSGFRPSVAPFAHPETTRGRRRTETPS
jgi:hypothetical protein